MGARSLRVCVMHLGDARGGVSRYSRQIADALCSQPNVEVVEVSSDLNPSSFRQSVRDLLKIARAARRADVLLAAYSRYHWWPSALGRFMQTLILHALCRRTVLVFHDVNLDGMSARAAHLERIVISTHLARSVPIVHNEHERARLSGLRDAGNVTVVPFLIEPVSLSARQPARKRFGLDDSDVVAAVLGWIHPTKGHAVALEALATTDQNVRLWFLGGVPDGMTGYARELTARAAQLGIADRLTVTGYLPDVDLAERLAAVDVGLCPFLDASASASLATWLGTGLALIASDVHVVREHAMLAPSVFEMVPVGKSDRIAEALAHVRDRPKPSLQDLERLRHERSSDVVADRYVALLTRASKS